jgi:hypothetical protein
VILRWVRTEHSYHGPTNHRSCSEAGSALWGTPTDYDTFAAWVKTTLDNGTSRFTMNVWLGTSLASKVCQFIKPGSNLIYAWVGPDAIDVTMTLRVFDV